MLDFLIGIFAFFGLAAVAIKATNYFADRWAPADRIDVEKVLRQYDRWSQFKSGELKCASCNRPATFDTLGLLVEATGEVVLVCKNPACVIKYFRAEEAHFVGG